jgi:hypothetical protein
VTEKQSKLIKESSRGGKRPGAGRKPGVRNKKTAALQAEVEASGQTPLDYMLSVMRNTANEESVRLDAAKSAAPYVHSKLASVEVNANVTTHEASLEDLE